MSLSRHDVQAERLIAEVYRTKRWLRALQEANPAKARQVRTEVLQRMDAEVGESVEEVREAVAASDHPRRQEVLVRFLRYLIEERGRRSKSSGDRQERPYEESPA